MYTRLGCELSEGRNFVFIILASGKVTGTYLSLRETSSEGEGGGSQTRFGFRDKDCQVSVGRIQLWRSHLQQSIVGRPLDQDLGHKMFTTSIPNNVLLHFR
jgi:uncharacterized protein YhjY with autotransporter beta-barrel domain